MSTTFRVWLMMAVAVLAAAQYDQGQYEPQPEYQQPQPRYQQAQPQYQSQQAAAPLPAILMHKQALGNDGSFNYAFAADNGLQQGETISPDGTRAGSYSYVDPNGKTIKVKYTAGKDGFKVLEGDHLPKAPAPVAPQPARPSPYHQPQQAGPSYQPQHVSYQAQQPAYQPQQPAPVRYSAPAPYSGNGAYQAAGENAALFGGQHHGGGSSLYRVQDDYSGVGDTGAPVFRSTAPATFPPSQQYARPQAEERQEPHSFGAGYSFEFAG